MLLLLLLTLVAEFVVPYSAQERTLNLVAECGSNVSLPCLADFSTNKYSSLTWYKNNKNGIIRVTLEDNQVMKHPYVSFPQNVTLDEQSYSLLLPKVTPADSGKYECMVRAKPGEQSLNIQMMLTVHECEPDMTTASLTTVQKGETVGTLLNVTYAPHLPLVWSLAGYSAVGLTKIILSMMIIWIFHICLRRKRRW